MTMYNWFSVERQKIITLLKLNLLMSPNLGNPSQDSFHQSKSDSTANSLLFALSKETRGTRNRPYGCMRLVRCALRIWANVNWGYIFRACINRLKNLIGLFVHTEPFNIFALFIPRKWRTSFSVSFFHAQNATYIPKCRLPAELPPNHTNTPWCDAFTVRKFRRSPSSLHAGEVFKRIG